MGWYIGLFVITVGFHASSAQAPTRELNDGYHIPILALGTAPNTTTRNETYSVFRKSVLNAIKAGFRHIDTASVYRTEPFVGEGIAEAIARGLVTREELFVTTKLWNDRHARDRVVPGLKESLENLGLDYVDLYLMHFPIAIAPGGTFLDIDYLETWKGLEDAKLLGLARSIGVSNFNVTQLSRLLASCNVRPAVNEVEVNPTYNNAELISFCKYQGIEVMAYSPLGFLVPRKRVEFADLPPKYDDPILEEIANKYGKTTPQIVYRYGIDRGVIPIAKSLNMAHIAQNLDIFDFCLTQNEVQAIDQFNRNIKVFPDLEWKKHPYYPFIPW